LLKENGFSTLKRPISLIELIFNEEFHFFEREF